MQSLNTQGLGERASMTRSVTVSQLETKSKLSLDFQAFVKATFMEFLSDLFS